MVHKRLRLALVHLIHSMQQAHAAHAKKLFNHVAQWQLLPHVVQPAWLAQSKHLAVTVAIAAVMTTAVVDVTTAVEKNAAGGKSSKTKTVVINAISAATVVINPTAHS